MRRSSIAVAFLLALTLSARGGGSGTTTLHVSRLGNDRWSGKLAQPNRAGSDGPFATLERARLAVRDMGRGGVRGGFEISIHEGTYRFDSTLVLDSTIVTGGRPPTVWGAFGGDRVVFSGSHAVEAFQALADSAVLKRLAGRSEILVADLRSQGITEFGIFPNRMSLFFRGTRMPVARYPNEGWLTIADVPQEGGRLVNPGDAKVIQDGHPAGRHYGRFTYGGDRPGRWIQTQDIWMHGYWQWDWRDGYQKVDRIDSSARTVYPAEPHHHYGYGRAQRFCFLNVLEELDCPGEWCLDETKGLLYFWPPEEIREGDVAVSVLRQPMVILRDVAGVEFRGIIFEESRSCAVRVVGGTRNLVAGCTIRNIDNDTSIVIAGGTRNGVRSCDIHDVGSVGIKLVGGDKRTLGMAGNFALNNHIQRYGCITQAFSGAIWVEGVGNHVAHNRIHDAPFSGIQYYGNEHVIEFNEIYDLAHESGDVGGVNTGADYSDQGTQIRYNYFHDTHGYGSGGYRAVYLDLPGSGTTIYGNIFWRVDIGVFFNSGRDNVVQNNIFVDCHPSVNIYVWPHRSYFHEGGAWKIVEKLNDIRYQERPYSTRYPKLPGYLDSVDLGMPYGNEVVNNISVGGTWLDLSEDMDRNRVRVEKNIAYDTLLLVLTKRWTPDYDPYHIGYAAVYQRGDSAIAAEFAGTCNYIGDPRFCDPAKGDFRLREDSPAWRMGFKRIPVEKIGLQLDEYRHHLPTE